MRDERVDDPVAGALLSESHYERLRTRRYSPFKQSIPRKLALQGFVLAALALVYPLAITLPASTRELFPSGNPLASTPKILLLGAYAGTIELLAVLGLVYVGYRLQRDYGDLGEREAHRLLTVEDVASMISLVTGAVAAVDGFFLLGHAGPAAMATFLDSGGKNPFAATRIPVSVTGIAVPAAVVSILAFALSWFFARHLPSR